VLHVLPGGARARRAPTATLGGVTGSPLGKTAVTVFGGSRVLPDSDEYAAAQQLGSELAKLGWAVVTGGYNGTMEAVSRGANEVGGHVIGVTVELIARNFARTPNAYLDQELKTAALLERIDKMIELGTAYVVLPGGSGTLAELGIVWNLALLGGLHGKPLVVVGSGWHRLLHSMVEELHTSETDLQLLRFVPDVSAAVDVLVSALT
jgi:uncharacterized protein (TIGR00730 family)